MAKIKNSSKKKYVSKQPKLPKISPVHCPNGMSLKEWQRALRRQAAENEIHIINGPEEDGIHFGVTNPKSGRTYTVEYFGKNAPYNRCDCMDFQTNQLGTCKHIESVSLYKKGKYATMTSRQLEHSSVVVDYPAGRTASVACWRD